MKPDIKKPTTDKIDNLMKIYKQLPTDKQRELLKIALEYKKQKK